MLKIKKYSLALFIYFLAKIAYLHLRYREIQRDRDSDARVSASKVSSRREAFGLSFAPIWQNLLFSKRSRVHENNRKWF